MNTTGTDRDKIVIPDTDGAQLLAERFSKFLTLGACQSAGVGAADRLARDPALHRVEQENSDRSALPAIQNQVGSCTDTPQPELELGANHEQTVSVTGGETNQSNAHVEHFEGTERNQEGDQLRISY